MWKIYLFFSAKVEKFTESEREQTFLMYIQTLNKPAFLAWNNIYKYFNLFFKTFVLCIVLTYTTTPWCFPDRNYGCNAPYFFIPSEMSPKQRIMLLMWWSIFFVAILANTYRGIWISWTNFWGFPNVFIGSRGFNFLQFAEEFNSFVRGTQSIHEI